MTYTVSGSGGSLSADFTGITNLSRNAAHSTSSVSFSNIEVGSSGQFSKLDGDRKIEGSFFGGSGAEIAGTFDTLDIHGAYETRRSN